MELGLIANKVEVKVEVAMQQGGSKGGTRWNSELGNPRELHNPMYCDVWLNFMNNLTSRFGKGIRAIL